MEPVFRMVVGSDVHYKEGVDTEPERFEKGMALAYRYADSQPYKQIDALYIVGDFANSGSEEQMRMFRGSIKKTVRENTEVTLTMASHEYRDGEEVALKRFADIFGMEPDTHKVINGFHLIAITTENGCRIKEQKQEWLRNQLRIAAEDDPKRPIFVFQHPHLSGTVYGSINWGEDDIIEILMDYPQVIDFSGHSHAPVNDPRSIHQKYFTSVGTGSYSYFELDEFDKQGGTVPADAGLCAQYLIVEAFENGSVIIKPFDILSESFFPDHYFISRPWDPESYIYTENRYHTDDKPVFDSDASVNISINGNDVSLRFPQAGGKELPDSYTIVVKEQDSGLIVRQLNISSSYYLQPFPAERTVHFGVARAGHYIVTITANSFWYTASAPLTAAFTIK